MNKLTLTRDVARSHRHEIDFADILRSLWRGKFIILACLVVSLFAAARFLNTATYKYTAELRVTPINTANASLPGALNQLGQVAALAGIGIGNDQSASVFQLYLEGLFLRETAETLSTNQDLMKVVFLTEWDDTLEQWREPPPSRFAPIYLGLRSLFGVPIYPWQPPDASRLHDYIKGNIKVIQGTRSPVATVTFKHPDPKFAVTFLTALDEAVDSSLRRKMLARTSEYIAYLSQALRTVTIAEHRLAMVQALSEQEKLRMMASSSTPYAAEVFGRPITSVRPTDPRPLYVLMVMLAAGLVVGGLLARVIYPGRGTQSLAAPVEMRERAGAPLASEV